MRKLLKKHRAEFEIRIRELMATMDLPKEYRLYFSHTDTGMRAAVGQYEEGHSNQCEAITQAGKRCKVPIIDGGPMCGHHVRQTIVDVDE